MIHSLRNINPTTDTKLDEEVDQEGLASLKPRMQKVGGTIMSGCQSTTSRPIINVIALIVGVDGMLTLRNATDSYDQSFVIHL